MDKIKAAFDWFNEETLFWGEVLTEVLGIYRNKYTKENEKRLEEKRNQERLEVKKELYQSLNV